jgi:hypothetical protein
VGSQAHQAKASDATVSAVEIHVGLVGHKDLTASPARSLVLALARWGCCTLTPAAARH